jgi:hypothetical protein
VLVLQRADPVRLLRGGENTPDNTVPACGSCNRSKGMALYPSEWTPETGLDVAAVLRAQPLRPGGRLSARAYGVLAFIHDHPDVEVTPAGISRHFTEGRDAIKVAIGELVAVGALRISVIRDGNLIRWQFGVVAA